jgi:hypothetical protein
MLPGISSNEMSPPTQQDGSPSFGSTFDDFDRRGSFDERYR